MPQTKSSHLAQMFSCRPRSIGGTSRERRPGNITSVRKAKRVVHSRRRRRRELPPTKRAIASRHPRRTAEPRIESRRMQCGIQRGIECGRRESQPRRGATKPGKLMRKIGKIGLGKMIHPSLWVWLHPSLHPSLWLQSLLGSIHHLRELPHCHASRTLQGRHDIRPDLIARRQRWQRRE